jgi:transcriptional regulator with XRE-family HTH domain
MTPATRRVARRVAELRIERGLSQDELARRARLNRVTLARLEQARHPPRLDTLERIARALGVDITELLR